jgi:hypothetical protein
MTEHIARYFAAAERAGLPYHVANAIRRDAQRLHTWDTHECNGVIQRMEEAGEFRTLSGKVRKLEAGKVYTAWNINGPGPIQYSRTADRETPARKRIEDAAATVGGVVEFQGDPRGWPIRCPNGVELSPPVRG